MHQDDDIPGIVRYRTYEVLKNEVNNPRLRWAYLPYSMHMAGPREAIQHIIIRKNYGASFKKLQQYLLLPMLITAACCVCSQSVMGKRVRLHRHAGPFLQSMVSHYFVE